MIPAVIEVNEDQTAIEVFPDTPIPTGDTYAVVMNVFNPTKSGMFQFNALAQAPETCQCLVSGQLVRRY